jgi:hypothetical protein
MMAEGIMLANTKPIGRLVNRTSGYSIRNFAFALLIFAVCWAVSVGNAVAAEYVRTYQVSASANDGYASGSTSQNLTGLLTIGDGSVSSPYYMSAARFTGVNIPRSASVTNAVLKIQSIDQGLSGTVYGQIRSEASDDTVDFSSRYIASASLNSAAVNWDHTSAWSANTWYTSPNIASVVQPVLNRTGWLHGNDLTIFYRTRANSNQTRSFASFNSSPSAAPVLEVTYQVYKIWGHVRTPEGTPVEGVICTPSPDIEPTVSDSNGYYELLVPPLWGSNLDISKPGWYIYPNSLYFSETTSDWTNIDFTAIQCHIYGHVKSTLGAPLVGMQIVADGGDGAHYGITDASGNFDVAVPYAWTGTIQPNDSNWFFTNPGNRWLANVTTNIGGIDFTGFQPHITGYIKTSSGMAISYVNVTADNGGGSCLTDPSGYFDVAVPYNWSGTVWVSKSGWFFTPAGMGYNNVTSNISTPDFTAFMPAITGRVTDRNGNPRQNVQVSIAGVASTPTNSAGNYSLTVPYHWSGTVTPSLSQWGFIPAGRTYTDLITNQTDQNFTVFQPRVRGKITEPNGAPIYPVPVRKSDRAILTYSDEHGNYEFYTAYNSSLTVVPIYLGWALDPTMRVYTAITEDQNDQDYTGYTEIISGYVKEPNGAALSGAWLSAPITSDTAQSITDDRGWYIMRVPPGWSGTVTVSSYGWIFTPPNRTYDNVTANITDQNYTAIKTVIRGHITMLGGGPAADIILSAVTYGGSLAGAITTDSNGFYQFTIPYHWSGTITPNKTGFYFTPQNKEYFYVIADQNNQDYIAKSNPYGLGSGTPGDPYQIATAEALNTIGSHPEDFNKCFIQTADIDLAQFTGTQFKIIGNSTTPFTGDFNGNGHTVSNFKFNSNSTGYVGLFGYINGARISCLGLVEPNVVGSDDVGALVGINYEGTLTQCWVRGGFVHGNQSVGGLVGNSFSTVAVIRNCYAQTEVLGQTMVGGLVGANWGSVFNSYSTGPVNASQYFGGLIGFIFSDQPVSGCFWDINTSGQSTSPAGIGKTTAQMKTMFTYVSWPPLWNIQEGIDYPHLLWEGLPGEVFPSNWYAGGTGTLEDPYIISTAEHLAAIGLISDDWGKNFRLDADIDCAEFEGQFQPIGNSITYFTGVFDGQGHTISNLIIDSNGVNFVGLFGSISDGSVSCLGLINPNIRGADYVGALAGYNNGTLEQCWVRGGVVSGDEYVGGLTGYNADSIKNCYSQADVAGNLYIGGLIGQHYGLVTNCFSTGAVAGTESIGGFAGYNNGSIQGCFWDIETSGQATSYGGTGKTTQQMKDADTFIGWSCQEPAWTIDNGDDYPRVLCENAPGQPIDSILSDYLAGSGTVSDPYKISDAAALNMVGRFDCEWDKHFELTANIDMNGIPGDAYNIIGTYGHPFTGVFNGNNHTISNFSCVTNSSYVGLFGLVNDVNSRITNLRLVNPYIDAGSGGGVGSLAGYVVQAAISDCSVENGFVHSAGNNVGGLVGSFSGSGNLSHCTVGADVNGLATVGGLAGSLSIPVISDCSAQGNISGVLHEVGGFAGQASFSSLSNCYSSGTVTAGSINAGGFVGFIMGPPSGFDINNCHSNSIVVAKDTAGGFAGRIQSSRRGRISGCTSVAEVNTFGPGTAGGFAGFNDANISGCYVSATVTGLDRIGGLCGLSIGRIDTSRFNGSVNGTSNVGGLVGYQDYTSNAPSAIMDCYTEGQVVGTSNVGGLVGYNKAPLSNSYSACAISGSTYVGGIVGYPASYPPFNCVWDMEISEINKPCGYGPCESYGNRGRTTEQMKSAYSFAMWACDSNWLIDNSNDYPRLYWESQQGGPILETIFPNGSGDLNDPFLIDGPEQLIALGWANCIQNKNFALTVDLDLADFNLADFRSIGAGSYQWAGTKGGCFTGTFDGQGHVISDFNYHPIYVPQQENYSGGGLFACLDANAQVKNLGMVRPDINGSSGRSQDCGPLAGYVYVGTISNCFSYDGNIAGTYGIGGLVGRLGSANAKIFDSYSTTNVTATGAYAGGLVGYNIGGVIQRCYSAGEVNSLSLPKGGFIGAGSGNVGASFWDINTSGQLTSAGGTGLTTEQMKTYSYYANAGWDFNNVWHICETTNYPKLIWQMLSADYLCPDGVDFIDFSFLSAHWLQTDYGNCGGFDITGDAKVDLRDFVIMAGYWQWTGCGNCGGADYNHNGRVDTGDLELLCDNWLVTEYGDVEGAELTGDGIVDIYDVIVLSSDWLKEI